MNLKKLRDRARAETGDLKKPYLWSDDEWRDYFNEAANEAAIRARLIEDDQIEVETVAGEAYAEYPEHVWAIQRVLLGDRVLVLTDRETIDASEGDGWELQTGTPWACYEVGGKLRLYPIPVISATARMVAFCIPEKAMVEDGDEPGLRLRVRPQLLDWALHLAYLKKDADTFDANLAALHETEFEKTFGPKPDEKAMRRKRINVTRRVAGRYF